jgi:ornithine cyclodeaminase/alanine dehydrogenase-like protein (mu-crystallin family)
MPKVIASSSLLLNDRTQVRLTTSSLNVVDPTTVFNFNLARVSANTVSISNLLVDPAAVVKLFNSSLDVFIASDIFQSDLSSVMANTIASVNLLNISPNNIAINLPNDPSVISVYSVSAGEQIVIYDPNTASQIWYTS